jgi:hypothetical protein
MNFSGDRSGKFLVKHSWGVGSFQVGPARHDSRKNKPHYQFAAGAMRLPETRGREHRRVIGRRLRPIMRACAGAFCPYTVKKHSIPRTGAVMDGSLERSPFIASVRRAIRMRYFSLRTEGPTSAGSDASSLFTASAVPATWARPGEQAILNHLAVERVVKFAVRRAGIMKPGSCHRVRHSFHTHLLERGASCENFGAMRFAYCALRPLASYILARDGGGFGGGQRP